MAEPGMLAAVDRWLDRFRDVDDPPEPFATALREGWAPGERERLAEEAEEYARRHAAYLREIAGAGVDLVRFDCKLGSCGVCAKYCGKAYSLGEEPELPPPPPLPICPACRHTLNLLTPFYMQSLGIEMEDLIAEAQPFVDDEDGEGG